MPVVRMSSAAFSNSKPPLRNLNSTRTEEEEEVAEVVPEAAEAVTEVEEVLPEEVLKEVKDRAEHCICQTRPSPHYEEAKFKSTTYE